MRAFIVLCLVATACAQSGYNYQAGGGSGNGGLNFGASNGSPSFAGGPSFGGSGAGPSFGGSSSGGPGFGGSSSGGPGFGGVGAPSNDAGSFAPQGELEKEFFTFTADEQDFNDPAASNQIASNLKQGLRVVFIKGPENRGLEDAALALAKQAADQKTAIYVLNKQTDLGELANRLNTENSNANNKPEVHFVKYRTPEDAANAQKTIQAEYDNLGGQSQHIDGGVAPSLNFASKAPAAPAGGQQGSFGAASGPAGLSNGGQQGSFGGVSSGPPIIALGGNQGSFGAGAGSAPTGTYLPAALLRRFRH